MSIAIGICGFGRHALGRIMPIIEADARLRLVSVWARSEASQALLRERGIPATADFARFLATPMELAYVASPTGLHCEHAAALLRAGRHVWVEKPLATALAEVEELVNLARERRLMLAEAFMFPWHAQAAEVRRLLADGEIGALRSLSLTFCFPHLDARDFRYDPALGGGAFLDHACYLVKALDSYAGGDWRFLGGCLEHGGHAVDIAGAAQLRREEDGVVASLNWGFGRSYINEIEFVGERGRMRVQSAFTKPGSRPCDILLEDSGGARSLREVRVEDPYARMIEGFTRQFGDAALWPGIQQDILRHAERLFALRAHLQRQQALRLTRPDS